MKEQKKPKLYIKPHCGWCHEAMDWLDQRGVDYQKVDVTSDAEAFEELRRVSGQTRTPTMQIDGEVLADFGVEELEPFWKKFEAE